MTNGNRNNRTKRKKIAIGDKVIAKEKITNTPVKTIKPGDICTVTDVEDYNICKMERYITTDEGQILTVWGPDGETSEEINATYFKKVV